MTHAIGIGRLGGLAVGLGIGVAVAATPGAACADPFSPQDPDVGFAVDAATGAAALGPAAPDPLDLAISIDGVTLLQAGSATATSSFGDVAIASAPAARPPPLAASLTTHSPTAPTTGPLPRERQL